MKKITIFTAILFTANLLFAQVINIPADYPTIQQGIDAASDGDTVLVQPGTYAEHIELNGKGITLASIILITQDTTYISQTIIFGWVGIKNVSQNFSLRFCGFTVTNVNGIGISCSTDNVEIENTRVIGCKLYGINILNCSNNSLKNVTISNNYDLFSGINIGHANVIMENVIISDNMAAIAGGGICCYASDLVCNNVTISGNTCNDSINGNNPCLGGGIYCSNSSILFQNGFIKDNSADDGGGVYCIGSSAIFQNVLMTGNTITSDMGTSVLYAGENSQTMLNNVTISGNEQIGTGGWNLIDLIYCDLHGSASMMNSIIFNNNDLSISLVYNISIIYSNIEGGHYGEGNIDEDPLFLGLGDYPYQINDYSPCIDAGTPDTTGLNLPELDLAGNPRIVNNRIDMGAYEWNMLVGMEKPVENDTKPTKVSIYPNPVSVKSNIEFELKKPEHVSIQIFNNMGEKITDLAIKEFPAGHQQLQWNMSNLPEGIYFCSIQIGNESIIKKIIKVN